MPITGITISDDAGNAVPGATKLRVRGAGSVVSAGASGGAELLLSASIDPTGVDAVIRGGDWIARDLVRTPSYEIAVAAGVGVISGSMVSWAASRVITPAENALIVVGTDGIVRARVAGSPELLPTSPELLLLRTYVSRPTYGNRIYAVAESRTFYRAVPRSPLCLLDRVKESVIASGTWANAVAMSATGDINWYFANLGLYPFCEELPTIVKNHLDVQIAKFYGGNGTANASPTWNSVHGTTYGGAPNYLRWPYDVATPRGTPTVKRADSHDAYAGTFLRLAARYWKVTGDSTWWDANVTAMQDALYYNIETRMRLVNNAAGYMVDTFQDATVYPFNQTLDNMEAYRGVFDALAVMTARGGAQASWAAARSGLASNILSGIQSQWSTAANAAGESNWMSAAYDIGAATKLSNPLTRFYPDLTIAVPAAMYDVPLHGTNSIARERLAAAFSWLNTKAPTWFMSRKYDLYPWGLVAAAAAKVGFADLAERWLTFIQTHHVHDAPGYVLIHDVGHARYVQRVLQGDVLA